MSHTCTKFLVHVVFSTKERQPLLSDDVRTRVFAYLGGIVREIRGKAVTIGGMSNHVHALVQLPSDVSPAEAVRTLKSNSSRWIHETWPEMKDFSWQTGYGAFSVSESIKPELIAYIEHQPEHHKRRDFRAEVLALLQKHGIAADEKYLWN